MSCRDGVALSIKQRQSVLLVFYYIEWNNCLAVLALSFHTARERANLAAVRHRRRGNPPKQVFEHFPKLPSRKAVQDRVQATVGVRQASSHWENVRLDHVVRLVKLQDVQFHQDAPKSHGLVWHPADEKREHYDCN